MSHIGYHSHTKSKGSKLGYYRASLACSTVKTGLFRVEDTICLLTPLGYCRKRKVRCIPSADGDGEGCTTCARLNRPCVTVARAVQLSQKGSSDDVPSPGMSLVQPPVDFGAWVFKTRHRLTYTGNADLVRRIDSHQKKAQSHRAGHTQIPGSGSSSKGSANPDRPAASPEYHQPLDSTLTEPLQTQMAPLATDLESHDLATGFHGYPEYFPFHYFDPLRYQPPAVSLNEASHDNDLPSDFMGFSIDRSCYSIFQSEINPVEHSMIDFTAPSALSSNDGDANSSGNHFTVL